MISVDDILNVYIGSGDHPSLPRTCPLTESSRIFEWKNWMRDVRMIGTQLLEDHDIPVPEFKGPSKWPLLEEEERNEMNWYKLAKPLLIKAAKEHVSRNSSCVTS